MKKKDNYKTVAKVEEGSLAQEGDIRPGDRLISVNGFKIKDFFDYKFLTTDTDVTLKMQDPDGDAYEVTFEKDEYENLGIEFESELMDEDRGCKNKCIFCFIDQLPENMRETVYFKDDDTRLSFLTGNYVTLTNVDYDELDRIVKYRMSPINVSVHTTEPELRKMMLRNRFAGDIMKKLKVLADGCITVNAQIVLCPDVNDKEHLKKTLDDLSTLSDCVASVSVVPVGLTKHRDGLFPLRNFTAEESEKVIETVEEYQKSLYAKLGRRFVYAADEFYINCGRKMPDYDSYDGFPQLENGVGMCSLLENEVITYITEHKKELEQAVKGKKRRVTLVTGRAAYDIINGLANYTAAQFDGVCDIIPVTRGIENNFFGNTVTVAGLLTGTDIVNQLKGENQGDEILITENMLRNGENVLLDDMTTEDIKKALGVSVRAVGKSGREFAEAVLGI